MFVNRISYYSTCSDACFVIASIYIERLCQIKNLTLTHQNIHRVIGSSVIIAIKFYDDHRICNRDFSRCAGIRLFGMTLLNVLGTTHHTKNKQS